MVFPSVCFLNSGEGCNIITGHLRWIISEPKMHPRILTMSVNGRKLPNKLPGSLCPLLRPPGNYHYLPMIIHSYEHFFIELSAKIFIWNVYVYPHYSQFPYLWTFPLVRVQLVSLKQHQCGFCAGGSLTCAEWRTFESSSPDLPSGGAGSQCSAFLFQVASIGPFCMFMHFVGDFAVKVALA